MKPSLKIDFAHFWPHFNKEDNLFVNLLRRHFEVKINPDPQLLIFTNDSSGSREYLKYTCHKLFVGLENERTDFNSCDFAIDFDYLDKPNHLRVPLWALWDLTALAKPKSFTVEDIRDRKDCCMLVSNGNAKERIKFFKQLSQYLQVDSGGKYLNNIGGPVADKMEFIRNYKFVISFENSSRPGYVTEKLIEPMLANTIPIYWGDNTVGRDFNSKSFINIHDYPSYEDAIQDLVRLCRDDAAYVALLNRPWCPEPHTPPMVKYHASLEKFLIEAVQKMGEKKAVSDSYRYYIHLANLKYHTLKSLILIKLKLNFR